MPNFIPGAGPFFYEGDRVGCLLVHGFTGTPLEMRGLGDFLHHQFHYTVSGPALAGHATHYAECAPTIWQDWYASVVAAYLALTARCDYVFAIGLSLGGALVLHLAVHKSLNGVVSIAAPFQVRHPFILWFRLFPLLHRLFPYILKDSNQDDTQDPHVRLHHRAYDRTPTLAARSMVLGLLPELRGELGSIQLPALVIHSRADRTVTPDSAEQIYARLGSGDKALFWLKRGGHLVLEDYGKEEAFRAIAEFIARQLQIQVAGSMPSPFAAVAVTEG